MAQPAVTIPAPTHVKGERDPTLPPSPPPPQPLTTPIKQEEEETQRLAIIATDSEQLQTQQSQAAPSPPPIPYFIDAINELRHLSAALSAFHGCYDDLQTHITSIESAIDSQLNSQTPKIVSPPHEILPIAPVNEPTATPPSIPVEEKENEKEKEILKPNQSELEGLCLTMSSRGLRKYVVTNLGEANKLREEVPKALKLAHNPAKLVLDCVGRFFLQGSKAYTKDSPMITAREASVLMLECFLLAHCDVGRIDEEVKEESGKAAIAWRKRLVMEGGLAKACEIDARGLLMFIGCFGIPLVFKIQDFRDLIRAGNVKEISSVLKMSSALMTKISDVIESMVKMKMAVDAVDVSYTFGFEDKLSPQTILFSFLREAKESWKRTKKWSQGSLSTVNEANKKYLTALLSVIKCLESHNIDPSKFLPGWQINEKTIGLEKDITDFDKKIREQMVNKRKADETLSPILRNQEVKRFRYVDQGLPQQQVTAHLDSRRRLLDSVHGHTIRSLASPPLMHGAGVGHGVVGAGVSSRISTGASYPGIYGEALVDTAGQAGNYGGQLYGLRGDAAAYSQRLAAPTYAGEPPAYGLSTLYRPSPSLEEFAGLPSSSTVGVASRNTASDLYQFADVVDSETYQSSGSRVAAGAAVPSVVPAHHPSYLY